jgi:hypothetical protein
MAELQPVAFVVWSAVTGAVFIISGVVYRMYLKKKSDPLL